MDRARLVVVCLRARAGGRYPILFSVTGKLSIFTCSKDVLSVYTCSKDVLSGMQLAVAIQHMTACISARLNILSIYACSKDVLSVILTHCLKPRSFRHGAGGCDPAHDRMHLRAPQHPVHLYV